MTSAVVKTPANIYEALFYMSANTCWGCAMAIACRVCGRFLISDLTAPPLCPKWQNIKVTE